MENNNISDKNFVEEIRDYVERFCLKTGYPKEAVDTLTDTFDRITADDAFCKEFFAPVYLYAEGKDEDLKQYVEGGSLDKSAEKLGLNPYTVDLLFFLCLVPFLQKRYENAEIDEEIFYDSVADLRYKLAECKKLYGVWGTFVGKWFADWFTLKRFGLGRLQFEIKNFHYFSICGGKLIRCGHKLINIHIPSSGPLNHDEVLSSYKKAYDFFRKDFKGRYILFQTASWLLFKPHRKMLPPTSNIVRFMDDFSVVVKFPIKNNGDFWRVFGRKYDKNNPDFSGDTALQKGYAALLRKGKCMGGAIGVFWFDGTRFLGGKNKNL